jgi:type IV pilus assembly protein PilC
MKYKFNAIKKNGERYSGFRDSADKFSLYADLKIEGDTLISATAVDKKDNVFFQNITVYLESIGEQKKIFFAKNLGAMLESGLALARALTVMEKQIENKNFKALVSSMNDDIKKGETLSESSRKHPSVFSSLFVSMVKAGEESGNLAGSLKIVGEQMDSSYKLKKKIQGALIYPAVILILMIAIGVLMMVYVVPSLSATFSDLSVELPAMTKAIVFLSDFLKNNILVSLAVIIVVALSVYFFSLSKTGKKFFDFVSIKTPVISPIVKEVNSARTARTLSSLLSSGVPFAEAILITSEVVQNHYFREVLDHARLGVEKGEPMSKFFIDNSNLYPVFVGEMMAVGEETGNISGMLMETAEFYENSVDQKTKDMSTIIEPVLMIIIGIAVGIFAFSMITPIYSLMDKI